MQPRLANKLILLAIFLFAAALRMYNPDWDQNFHLHPDERFLTLVGTAMKMPQSFEQYLDPKTSLLNPANINYQFYVYGTFPVVLNKVLAIMLSADTYNDFTIVGRVLSAFFDLLTLLVLVKLMTLFKKQHQFPEAVVYFSAFFYAITVFAIQQSHFFTTDSFMSFFMLASLYCMLLFYYTGKSRNVFLSSVFFALGLACKVTAAFISPLLMFFLILRTLPQVRAFIILATKNIGKLSWENKKIPTVSVSRNDLLRFITVFVLFSLICYLVLRLADPYYFKERNLLNPQPNPTFVQSIRQLEVYSTPAVFYPPSVQWIHKMPVIFALYNLAFWGVGIVYFMFIVLGIYFVLKKHQQFELLVILGWVLLFFFYQSTQFVKTMRYFIFLYPFFAFYAGIGFYYIANSIQSEKYRFMVQLVLIILLLIYPLSFMSIYVHPVTRVSATQWIYAHVPPNSFLLNEYWDDPLPLPLTSQVYPGAMLPVFDPDTPQKWQKMNELLQKGNYLILSSNRGWGSIPTVPERYPHMTRFYQGLFAGKLPYKKVAEFTSYPSLTYLGIPLTFPDDCAEEAFTVYDHPRVMIFKKY